nr:MAG TPA: hypothetical protein [Inoviridae sp.]
MSKYIIVMRTGIRIYLYRSYLFWLIICIIRNKYHTI